MNDSLGGVELVHWNPTRHSRRSWQTRYRRIPYEVNNFGDLLGPLLARRMLAERGIPTDDVDARVRLLTVGSILHHARSGDVVWGTGVSGKHSEKWYRFRDLDVRSVRGPMTAEFLQRRSISVPPVTGDPGLLVGTLWDREWLAGDLPRTDVLVIPNLNDVTRMDWPHAYLDPRSPVMECLGRIAAASMVVGSSLHGIVIAESLGIPARLVVSVSESKFKYEDYYLGSGRPGFTPAKSVRAAIEMGGEPPADFDPNAIIGAFPFDLWERPK